MTHVWAVLLGIAQGAAEFLPISSTAHLKMLPWLFGMNDPVLSSSTYDIALHAGSLIAILLALWGDWVDLVLSALGRPREQHSAGRAGFTEKRVEKRPGDFGPDPLRDPVFARRFLGFLLVTSIPGGLLGVLFESSVERYSTPALFHGAPLVVGISLILFGVLLYVVDRFMAPGHDLDKMIVHQSLAIGLAQALALVPGVSRSGSTMTAGRAIGLSRQATARFSFMAAAPIIGGASLFGLRHVELSQLLSLDWVLGFMAAAVTSILLMRWMLDYVKNHSFAVFMWYRIVAGLLLIAVYFARG